MSATILGPPGPTRESAEASTTPAADVESTTDLHEESTTDLSPATEDVTQDTMPRPSNDPQRAAPAPSMMQAMHIRRVPNPARRSAPAPKAAPAGTPGPGSVLCERYLLEQIIGRGGTAVVYRARDMESARGDAPCTQVAIKMPRPEVADRARAALRLKHEFEHARRLSHPNIVRVMHLHEDTQSCFMAMESIEGRLLSHLLRDWTLLSPPLAYKILRGCGQALAHAHSRDVVHGDFKPGNVFVTADERVKVVDFGAAATTLDANGPRIPAGTPAYASPEVLSGETPEPRDDVFSFACVAYEVLTGQHPFERRSSLQAREARLIPPRAWNLTTTQWLALFSALSWERAQRPADIDTLLGVLTAESQNMPDAVPVLASPDAMAPPGLPAEFLPRHRSWGFFIFVACALAVILLAMQKKGDSDESETGQSSAASVDTVAASPPPAARNVATAGSSEAAPAPSSSASEAAVPPRAAGPGRAAASSVAPAARPTAPKQAVPQPEISFEPRSIVTSEASVAAVFLIRRSPPLSGRVGVQWSAVGGSADAGRDFASDARGTVVFADGQAQRAIYVPLHNDRRREGDETFSVRLHSPQQARLGAASTARATIRDDD